MRISNLLRKSRFLLFYKLFCISPVGFVMAQTVDNPIDLPSIMPMSPQGAQYMRYGEVPVGLSTGVPEISVPIYTLEANRLQIPINISYHASGIKVQDITSTVGLGWVLNAGGIISQTMIEGNDNFPSPNFHYANSKEAADFINQKRNFNSDLHTPWFWYTTRSYITGQGGPYNAKSDIYHYNFNGHTGSFLFDTGTLGVVTVPYVPYRIEFENSETITIVDTEGRRWTFRQMGRYGVLADLQSSYTYDFYLASIAFPDIQEKVVFEYHPSANHFALSKNTQSEFYGYYFRGEPSNDYRLKYERNYSESQWENYSALLKKITWKNISIDLTYRDDSRDANITDRLTSISVKAAGQEKIYVNLHNDKYLGTADRAKRMLLDKIDVNGDEYSFGYDETPLPTYDPVGVFTTERPGGNVPVVSEDFWGYFNDAGARYLIPFFWDEDKVNAHGFNPDPAVGAIVYKTGRESNPNKTQAGILKHIKYPTGGRTVFEYEQNQGNNVYNIPYRNGPSDAYFGGVRIKTIKNYDSDNSASPVLVRTYEYEGGPPFPISYAHFSYEQYTFFNNYEPVYLFGYLVRYIPRYNTYTNHHRVPADVSSFYGRGNNPYYHTVTEYIGTKDANSGKIVHKFDKPQPATHPPLSDVGRDSYYPGPYIESNYDYRMLPVLSVEREEYRNADGNYIPVLKETNQYTGIAKGKSVVGVDIGHRYSFDGPLFGLFDSFYLTPGVQIWSLLDQADRYPLHQVFWDEFMISNQYAYSDTYLPSRTSTTEYFDSGSMFTTEINYSYDPQGRVLTPVRSWRWTSDEKILAETFTYPFDEGLAGMVNANIVSPVITKTTTSNGLFPGILETVYEQETYRSGNIDHHRYIPKYVRTGTSTSGLETRISFLKRDEHGNPVYITKDDITKIVYIWGYRGRYPIAEIQNATYDQLTMIISEPTLNTISKGDVPTSLQWDQLKSLQTDPRLSHAHVTIYSYDPLFGVSEIISPRGDITLYTYDSRGRLTEVAHKDTAASQKEVIETYEYNYGNR